MFRKLIITLMVLSALGVSIAGWISFSRPLVQAVRLTPKVWLAGAVFDGRARLFLLTSRDERILDVRRTRGPRIEIVVTDYQVDPWVGKWPELKTVPHLINLGARSAVTPFGGTWRRAVPSLNANTKLVWNTFIRAPVTMLVIALLAYPAAAFIRGPLRTKRRAKRGLCVHCGYNLTGLTEPRCPECGTSTGVVDS